MISGNTLALKAATFWMKLMPLALQKLLQKTAQQLWKAVDELLSLLLDFLSLSDNHDSLIWTMAWDI